MTTKLINGVLMTEAECFEKNQKLIWSTIRKIVAIAQQIGVSKDDLFSEGSIGLLKAYRGFDESKGFAFSTYAVPYIKGYAQRFIRDKAKVVRVPRSAFDLSSRITKEGCDDLSPEEIANKLNEPLAKVNMALLSRLNIDSTDRPVSDDESKDITIGDMLSIETDFTDVLVNDFMNCLNEREQKLLELKLNGETQSSIGKALHCSQVQISRLLKKIGEKYRKYEEGNLMASQVKAKGNIDKAKKMLNDTDLPISKIAKETNTSPSTLRYHAGRIRKQEPESESANDDQNIKDSLNKLLVENKTLRTDNERLRAELEKQPEPALIEQENWKRKHDLLLEYIILEKEMA